MTFRPVIAWLWENAKLNEREGRNEIGTGQVEGGEQEGRREGERERENENERIIIFWNYEHFSSGFCLIKL